jgi:hypothetical protein
MEVDFNSISDFNEDMPIKDCQFCAHSRLFGKVGWCAKTDKRDIYFPGVRPNPYIGCNLFQKYEFSGKMHSSGGPMWREQIKARSQAWSGKLK